MKKLTKRDKIKLLLQLNRTVAGIIDNMSVIFDNAETSELGNEVEAFNNFKTFFNEEKKKIFNIILDKQVEIYAKYLSETCIDDALAYYASDSGREVTENMLQIQKECVALGIDLFDTMINKYFALDGNSLNEQTETEELQNDIEEFKKRYNL